MDLPGLYVISASSNEGLGEVGSLAHSGALLHVDGAPGSWFHPRHPLLLPRET